MKEISHEGFLAHIRSYNTGLDLRKCRPFTIYHRIFEHNLLVFEFYHGFSLIYFEFIPRGC